MTTPTPQGTRFLTKQTAVIQKDVKEIGHTLQEIGVRSGDQIIVPRRFFSREDLVVLIQLVQIAVSVAGIDP